MLEQGLEGYFLDAGFEQNASRNLENGKYIGQIRDLTVPREAGLAKNWARDAGFMFACWSGMPETVTTPRL
mgnify:CR=1 FL=1